MTLPVLNAKGEPMVTCDKCTGICCRYIAVPLDDPDNERDVSDIRWFLLHENVAVYIDDDDDWFIEFKTKCKQLKENNMCGIYEDRPTMCREHKLDECEMNGEGDPWVHYFDTPEKFLAYMDKHYTKKSETVYEKIDDDD